MQGFVRVHMDPGDRGRKLSFPQDIFSLLYQGGASGEQAQFPRFPLHSPQEGSSGGKPSPTT